MEPNEDRGGALDLSVIIPVRDSAEVLSRQLEALSRQQSTIGWEVVVADNGSSDDPGAVVSDWVGSLPALSMVDASTRVGPGHARNVGAAHARGRVLAFCDADDLVGDGWVDAYHRALLGADAATGPVLDVTEFSDRHWEEPGWSVAPRKVGRGAPYLPTHNMAVRAEAFREVEGFDEALLRWQDVELSLRLFQHGIQPVFVEGARVQRWVPDAGRHLARKFFAYGEGARAVARKHEGFVRREILFRPAHWCWWVVSRAPLAAVSPDRRRQWVSNAAWGSGWIWASVRPEAARRRAGG